MSQLCSRPDDLITQPTEPIHTHTHTSTQSIGMALQTSRWPMQTSHVCVSGQINAEWSRAIFLAQGTTYSEQKILTRLIAFRSDSRPASLLNTFLCNKQQSTILNDNSFDHKSIQMTINVTRHNIYLFILMIDKYPNKIWY